MLTCQGNFIGLILMLLKGELKLMDTYFVSAIMCLRFDWLGWGAETRHQVFFKCKEGYILFSLRVSSLEVGFFFVDQRL